jgi:hypothetical protein
MQPKLATFGNLALPFEMKGEWSIWDSCILSLAKHQLLLDMMRIGILLIGGPASCLGKSEEFADAALIGEN